MNDQIILEVKNVSKAYGRNQVLSGVSLEVIRGKVTSIVGENGSGKTTLLKIIMGILSADSGSITSYGRIGFCPQDQLVFNSLTIRENLTYFASAYGLRGRMNPGWKRIINEYVDRYQIRASMDTFVSRLSAGTIQKLNLILAMIHSPDLLILDEPYAAFDWESYLYFWDHVSSLKQQRVSILVVSHLIYDRSYIDKIYNLKNGNLTCE